MTEAALPGWGRCCAQGGRLVEAGQPPPSLCAAPVIRMKWPVWNPPQWKSPGEAPGGRALSCPDPVTLQCWHFLGCKPQEGITH